MSGFAANMIRAARLEAGLYDEVIAAPETLRQGAAVVLAAGSAAGLGSILFRGAPGVFSAILYAFLRWLLWSYFIFIIGAKLMPGRSRAADYQSVLRASGFAAAPGVFRVLGLIPALYPLVFLAVNIWLFAAVTAATKRVFGYGSALGAAGVSLLGWIFTVAAYLLLNRALSGFVSIL